MTGELTKDGIELGVHSHSEESSYIWPQSSAVREHLEWFMGLKLGFMMHWAPVTQLGLCESWPLSDEDADWARCEVDWTDDMEEFKDQYWNLNKTFNPVKFRPDQWAKLAKECGFQYVLFTTKHHDGFCMFDTQTTDYKITAPDCPFSKNKRANIVKEVFDAFRQEGLGISAYFSKPDWHSDAYWHRAFDTPTTRNVNYDIQKYPALWEEFVQYTHKQLTEITSEYGKIDVLWLDGGCVLPRVKGQDIRLGEIVEKIRSTTQPHLICCDRIAGGTYENIVTPEQTIPEKPLSIPWETCMTLGDSFSFHYDDNYKPAITVVHSFIDIVSKGGNLALNITPRPDGALPQKAVQILRQFGSWLRVNADGIYNTHTSLYQSEEPIFYTAKENAEFIFYIYDETPTLPACINTAIDKPVASVHLLRGYKTVPYRFDCETNRLILNTGVLGMDEARFADCFVVRY